MERPVTDRVAEPRLAVRHSVNRLEDRAGGAERVQQLQPRHPRREAGLERLRHPLELVGVGALEGVDRLLEVADDEKRAGHVLARAAAGGELRGEALDHLPLVGAGVLRLVDEDVVDAAVESVEHPVGDRRILEQPAHL